MFEVLRELNITENEVREMVSNTTIHARERQNRFDKVDFENLEVFRSFEVNTGHKNGTEIHVITWDADILIFNSKTKKAVTVLKARPHQVIRYCERFGIWVPDSILENARDNIARGWNEI